MAVIIPLAGKGSRFSDFGYRLPKPLIPVSGLPMIINVIRNIPLQGKVGGKWIFPVLQEHIDEYKIDKLLAEEVPGAIIIPISQVTQGQACTCLLAEPYLDPEEPVLITACDISAIFNRTRYKALLDDEGLDSVVWTFTRHKTLAKNPKARSWCALENNSSAIQGISLKKPISSDPYNDHAVAATFFFRRAVDFIEATKMMINENFRVNNEFYVDGVPVFMKKRGKKSVIFDVDYYLDWGSPEELYNFQRLEYFSKLGLKPENISEEDQKAISKLASYFHDAKK